MRRRSWRLAPRLLALLPAACLTVDPFFFDQRSVDEYRWDDDPCDPQLQGELVEVEHRRNGGPAPRCHPSRVPPEDREEGFVALPDGRRIHYVFAHRPGAEATLLFSHGTTWHLGRYWDRVELLWSMGYHVMIYDYPGYGRSEGEPDEAGVFAAAVTVLEQALPTMPDVDLDRVIFMGYSLGGAPTYELALRASEGQLSVVPRAVISESTFCDATTFAQDASRLDLPGELFSDAAWDNCGKIARLDPELPVLILHGTEDDFIVPVHARKLRDAAIGNDVTLRWVEGSDHGELPVVGGETYREWLADFITTHLPP